MDIELRLLQRKFLTGDTDAGLRVLYSLLRVGHLDAAQLVEVLGPILQANQQDIQVKTSLLALAFQTQLLDEQAQEALMTEAYPEFRPSGGQSSPCLNVFLDRYPVASLDLWSYSDVARAWPWLYGFYTAGIFKSQSREIFDIGTQRHITMPPKNILINVSAEPPFNTEIGRPTPPRNYDPYVSLYMIDSFDVSIEEQEEDESTTINHWLNCYEQGQTYGGPEEGGWWRDVYSPLATLYMGLQEEYMPFDDRPDYIRDAADFLSEIYEDDQGSGVDIRIQLQDHSMQYYVYPEGGYE